MKTHSILLILLSILFFSCKKNTPENPILPIIPKTINRIIIAPELFLQPKNTEIYIGLRYFKDYKDQDAVTATLNGQAGTQVSSTSNEIEGYNILFKFPAINQSGDFKFSCTVKNDQNSLSKDLTLRVVNDLSLNTIWNSLDKGYVSSFTAYVDRLKSTGFTLRTITYADQLSPFGLYFDNGGIQNIYVNKSLANNLQGSYFLTFNGNVLQEIKILHGEPIVDATFNKAKLYTDITNVYGNVVSQTTANNGMKATKYVNGNYSITVYENTSVIYSLITK